MNIGCIIIEKDTGSFTLLRSRKGLRPSLYIQPECKDVKSKSALIAKSEDIGRQFGRPDDQFLATKQ